MTGHPSDAGDRPVPEIDSTVPHSARVWNYWLGGKDNYPVDRAAGDRYSETYPQIVDVARTARYYLARAVRYLAADAGIRQFLDVGTGLPTVDNTHELAQRIAPRARIVYVDNDPLVLAHARALLTSTPEGVTAYIHGDLHDPDSVTQTAAHTLDFGAPIALILNGVLGHVSDYEEARSIVHRLMAKLPRGSYLSLADSVHSTPEHADATRSYAETGAMPYNLRTVEQMAGFFDGLELVEPGLVPLAQWRPDPSPFDAPQVASYGAIGRKP
jgi:O-methyltransferase involved in polyketide biosynthesis